MRRIFPTTVPTASDFYRQRRRIITPRTHPNYV